jgi:membrane protein DedA with SNARE-associated domain
MSDFVTNMIGTMGYAGLIVLMFVENVFPPIPSELIIPLAGYLAAEGRLTLFGVITAGTFGSVLGSLPLYYFGRKLGRRRLKAFADRRGKWLTLSAEDIEKSHGWFKRYGGVSVCFCRLVPGLRSLISLPAGASDMSLPLFLLYTTIGAALWTALLACAGFYLEKQFSNVEEYLSPVTYVVWGVIIVIYIKRVIARR